jgi:hypothetical protein
MEKIPWYRAKRGLLTMIVDELKRKHSVPPEINVSIKTVRKGSRRGRPVAIKGHISPLAEVEEYIVDINTQMSKVRQPISHKGRFRASQLSG